MLLLKIFIESFRLAIHELLSNKLRTFLSLLGITIGIFCIISVLAGVDSLQDNVKKSFDKLGNDIIYVKKMSWSKGFADWWKYLKRPHPSLEDYLAVKEKSKTASKVSYHSVLGFKTLKYKSRSASNAVLIANTQNFTEMFAVNFAKGRDIIISEFNTGSNKILLGHNVAETLFENLEPIGKTVKMSGQKYLVIGVLEKAGDDIVRVADFDDCVLISIKSAKAIANLKSRFIFDTSVNIKARSDVTVEDMKDEVTGILRAHRRIKPKEEENFSLNQMSMLTSLLDQVFVVLNMVGIVIGLFAMIVGMFSVANIMFVSVKERTSLIGIKKAIGAKRFVILLEFLIESVILCILGGLIGLLFVFLVVKAISVATDFNLFLSIKNISIGLVLSIFVGIISGLIPAYLASNLDPVEAIRS